MKKSNLQKGAAHLVLVVALVVALLGALGFLGYSTWQKQAADAGGEATLGTNRPMVYRLVRSDTGQAETHRFEVGGLDTIVDTPYLNIYDVSDDGNWIMVSKFENDDLLYGAVSTETGEFTRYFLSQNGGCSGAADDKLQDSVTARFAKSSSAQTPPAVHYSLTAESCGNTIPQTSAVYRTKPGGSSKTRIVNSTEKGTKFYVKGMSSTGTVAIQKVKQSKAIQLIIIDAAGTKYTQKVSDDFHRTLELSQNGKRILYSNRNQQILSNIDGSGKKRVGFTGYDPKLNPNGTRIIFKSSQPAGYKLNVYNVKTGKSAAIDFTTGYYSWSKDGSKIANVFSNKKTGKFQIRTTDALGGNSSVVKQFDYSTTSYVMLWWD